MLCIYKHFTCVCIFFRHTLLKHCHRKYVILDGNGIREVHLLMLMIPPKKKKAPKRFLEVDILGMKLHRIECSYH